jgi:hypothetical protein
VIETRKEIVLSIMGAELFSLSDVARYFEYDLATPRRSDGPEV